MRVLADVHAPAGREVAAEHVIEEHERSDAAATGGGQGAQDRHTFDVLRARADGKQGIAHGEIPAEVFWA
ncbi:hypothetical protein D3C78_1841500 [compost metagenome]